VVNAASRSSEVVCGPGAIASIQGRWFTDASTAPDPSGTSQELAGVRLFVNGRAVPIIRASATELNFLCPAGTSGSTLEVLVQTEHGTALPMQTTLQAAAPGIFSVDGSGSGQGAAVSCELRRLAMVRTYRFDAQPATAGDHGVVYATGLERK
jgi:uncharacterized protein (TIGR03437 family)